MVDIEGFLSLSGRRILRHFAYRKGIEIARRPVRIGLQRLGNGLPRRRHCTRQQQATYEKTCQSIDDRCIKMFHYRLLEPQR